MSDPLDDLLTAQAQQRAAPSADPLGTMLATQAQAPAPALQSSTTPAQAPGMLERIWRGMKDPIDGASQLLERALPDSFNNANHAVNNWIADKTGLLAKVPENNLSSPVTGQKTGIDGLIQQQEQDYQARRAAAGQTGFDGARLVGNIASPANLAIGAGLPGAATLLGKIGVGALGGAETAALSPVYGPDFWQNKAIQTGVGAVAGGALPLVTGAVSRVISPNASVNTDLAMLKAAGVQPTIGQTLGGVANTAEEKLQSVPLVGDMISNLRTNAKTQFNNAAINRATAPIGQSVDGAGTEAVSQAGNLISQAYTQGKSMLGNFAIDQQGAQELGTVKQMAQQLPKREQYQFNNLWNTFQKQLTPTGQLLPDGFKTIDSKLTSDAAKFSGSQDAYQQKLGDAIAQLQAVITNNAKRANPQAAQILQNADEAYANLVRVEGAAVGAKATNGVFTPGQLLTAVRGADQSVRDRATAQGNALMQDLAMAGQNVLGNKVPDSGTAGRLGYTALGGAMYAAPLPTLGAMGAGLLSYTSPVQSLLRGAVSARPGYAPVVANAFQKASPMLVPGAAQVGLGLLNYPSP